MKGPALLAGQSMTANLTQKASVRVCQKLFEKAEHRINWITSVHLSANTLKGLKKANQVGRHYFCRNYADPSSARQSLLDASSSNYPPSAQAGYQYAVLRPEAKSQVNKRQKILRFTFRSRDKNE